VPASRVPKGDVGIALRGEHMRDKRTSINQSIKGRHKATHGQGEATSQHHHKGQQTLRHKVTQTKIMVRAVWWYAQRRPSRISPAK